MNMTLIYKILVLLFALSALMGINIILNPTALDVILNLEVLDSNSDVLLRADLGGYVLGGGILMVIGVLKTSGVWIRAAAISILCIFIGRLYGTAIQGYSDLLGTTLSVDALMLLVLFLAGRHFDRVNKIAD